MKIAVDARPLAPPVTGIGVYTGSLLEQMVAGGHDWFLYGDRPLSASPWQDSANVQSRCGNCAARSLRSLFHANWQFARWAVTDEVSVYWSPRHHLPVTLPASIPAVVTVHDLVWRRYPDTMPWRNRQVERLSMGASLRRARRIIAVSEFTASEIAHYYPREADKCIVIREAGRPLGEPGSPFEDRPYFLFVGTLEPRKNIPALLEAFAGFLASGEFPHRLIVVGGAGWGGVSVSELCARWGIEKRVVQPGYVSDSDLAGLYSGAQALVLPSLYEGFGLPVVEAMSLGTPVIVSARGALPEVAGTAGLLVQPELPQSITDAMTAVASDAALRERLSESSRRQAQAFSWQRSATQTLAILESLAGSG